MARFLGRATFCEASYGNLTLSHQEVQGPNGALATLPPREAS